MGHIDDHTESIHLFHHFYSKFTESFLHYISIPAVGSSNTVHIVPGKSYKAYSQFIQILQSGELPVQDASLF